MHMDNTNDKKNCCTTVIILYKLSEAQDWIGNIHSEKVGKTTVIHTILLMLCCAMLCCAMLCCAVLYELYVESHNLTFPKLYFFGYFLLFLDYAKFYAK